MIVMCQLQLYSDSNKLWVKKRIMRSLRKCDLNICGYSEIINLFKFYKCYSFVLIKNPYLSYIFQKKYEIWDLPANNLVGREEIENRGTNETKLSLFGNF